MKSKKKIVQDILARRLSLPLLNAIEMHGPSVPNKFEKGDHRFLFDTLTTKENSNVTSTTMSLLFKVAAASNSENAVLVLGPALTSPSKQSYIEFAKNLDVQKLLSFEGVDLDFGDCITKLCKDTNKDLLAQVEISLGKDVSIRSQSRAKSKRSLSVTSNFEPEGDVGAEDESQTQETREDEIDSSGRERPETPRGIMNQKGEVEYSEWSPLVSDVQFSPTDKNLPDGHSSPPSARREAVNVHMQDVNSESSTPDLQDILKREQALKQKGQELVKKAERLRQQELLFQQSHETVNVNMQDVNSESSKTDLQDILKREQALKQKEQEFEKKSESLRQYELQFKLQREQALKDAREKAEEAEEAREIAEEAAEEARHQARQAEKALMSEKNKAQVAITLLKKRIRELENRFLKGGGATPTSQSSSVGNSSTKSTTNKYRPPRVSTDNDENEAPSAKKRKLSNARPPSTHLQKRSSNNP